MTNRRNGILYTGTTDDLARRAGEPGLVKGFACKYGLRLLVHAERYDDMSAARQRERNISNYEALPARLESAVDSWIESRL